MDETLRWCWFDGLKIEVPSMNELNKDSYDSFLLCSELPRVHPNPPQILTVGTLPHI